MSPGRASGQSLMVDIDPAPRNLATLYGLETLAWADVRARLEAGIPQAPGSGGPDRHSCWLTTTNADGSPHLTGIGAIFHEGTFWFETGRRMRKGANLARDPRCALAVALRELDVVLEGRAELVADPGTVAELVALWAQEGWPAEVDDTGTAVTAPFSAPSAGPPPWHVYRIEPTSAHGLLTVAPGGATRWDF